MNKLWLGSQKGMSPLAIQSGSEGLGLSVIGGTLRSSLSNDCELLASLPCRETFHAFTSVYQRPLYSRLSISIETLRFSPCWILKSSILSPQTIKQIFLGYWASVSKINSCLRHSPLADCPDFSGNSSMIFPEISKVATFLVKLSA